MNAYYELLKILKNSLDSNIDINTVTQGDINDVDLSKKTIFNLAHIQVNSATFEENVILMNVSIFAMALRDINKEEVEYKFESNDNEIDNHNTTLAVLRRTYNEIIHGTFNEADKLCVRGTPTLEIFHENRENLLDGWVMTIDLEVDDNLMCVCCE